MKLSSFLLVACLIRAQSGLAQEALSAQPPQPLANAETLVSQEQKKLAFEAYRIAETQDAKSMVGGHYYDSTAIWDYYLSSKDQEAAGLELQSQGNRKAMIPFFTISMALGLASFGGLGTYVAVKYPPDASGGGGLGHFDAVHLVVGGILGGLLLGSAVGAVGAYHLRQKSVAERHAAADGFNQRLLERLHLSLSLLPGAAKAGASIKF